MTLAVVLVLNVKDSVSHSLLVLITSKTKIDGATEREGKTEI